MKANNEKDKCARCEEAVGEIPINDEKGTYWICEMCNAEMYETDYTFLLTNYLSDQNSNDVLQNTNWTYLTIGSLFNIYLNYSNFFVNIS